MKISGRTFVVSGGASGLGRACVEDIVAHGGNVAILDLNRNLGEALVQKLGLARTSFFPCDVSDTESIAASVRAVFAWVKSTGHPLGGIIPAAGIGAPALILDKSLSPMSLASLDRLIAINLRGTLDLTRQFLPHLAQGPPDGPDEERGVVVLVASAAAFEGQMGQVGYAAAKGGVAAMTLPMARDLSRFGIRVVAVAPSLFDTPMAAPLSDKVRQGLMRAAEFPRRFGRADEFAALVRQVLENGMLNGTVIRLDGGMRMPSRL